MNIDNQDVWVLLISTIRYSMGLRYSMGRRSYMPILCTELYHKYKDALEWRQRSQIASEIEERLRIAHEFSKPLGDDCDHDTWVALASNIRRNERTGI